MASRSDIVAAVRTILGAIGEGPNREVLRNTPERYADALISLTSGYTKTAQEEAHGAIFDVDSHELVIVRDIDISSLCEHHMLPFTGKMHIGYLPNGRVLGLSKVARIAEVYARRLQVQERLTAEIATAVHDIVQPLGVAVVLECTHMCMATRGVQKIGALTLTQSMTGVMKDNEKHQQKFFSLLGLGKGA